MDKSSPTCDMRLEQIGEDERVHLVMQANLVILK
jgi:hypothetical protein